MVFKTENGNWILNFHIGASEADALAIINKSSNNIRHRLFTTGPNNLAEQKRFDDDQDHERLKPILAPYPI